MQIASQEHDDRESAIQKQVADWIAQMRESEGDKCDERTMLARQRDWESMLRRGIPPAEVCRMQQQLWQQQHLQQQQVQQQQMQQRQHWMQQQLQPANKHQLSPESAGSGTQAGQSPANRHKPKRLTLGHDADSHSTGGRGRGRAGGGRGPG